MARENVVIVVPLTPYTLCFGVYIIVPVWYGTVQRLNVGDGPTFQF